MKAPNHFFRSSDKWGTKYDEGLTVLVELNDSGDVTQIIQKRIELAFYNFDYWSVFPGKLSSETGDIRFRSVYFNRSVGIKIKA